MLPSFIPFNEIIIRKSYMKIEVQSLINYNKMNNELKPAKEERKSENLFPKKKLLS